MKILNGVIFILTLVCIMCFPAAAQQGHFMDSGQRLGNFSSSFAALGDFDKDGDLDAFVTCNGANKIWLNDGTGKFTLSYQNLGDSDSLCAAVGDLNKDGYPDVFVVNYMGASRIWINDKTGKFNIANSRTLSDANSGNTYVALGDLNGDGYLDAFVTSFISSNKIWLNKGTNAPGEFTDSGQNLGVSPSYCVALGDLNGDNAPDAFVGNSGANKVWLNNGTGIFTDTGQSLARFQSRSVALADLDGDGDLDAFVANALGRPNIDGPNWAWENTDGKGNFKFYPYMELPANASDSYGVVLNDFDRDGDVDAFVVNNGQPNNIWRNDGKGNFTKGQIMGSTESSWSIALGDLDRDGDKDAFIANNNEQPDQVWMNETNHGDIDGNGKIELKDAIIGLQVLAAVNIKGNVFPADVNGDKNVGQQEVVFILQTVSNLRK